MHANLDSKVILISERDSCALNWELHQSRWLTQEIAGHVKSLFLTKTNQEFLTASELAFTKQIEAQVEEAWMELPQTIKEMTTRHDDERQWWAENKETASLNKLNHGVRNMMAKAGGAKGQDVDESKLEEHSPESPKKIRTLSWLLFVRAEIAFRRISTGMVCKHSLDFHQEDDLEGLESWFLKEFAPRTHPFFHMDRVDQMREMTTKQLLTFVKAEEHDAAAFGFTGSHLAPSLLDLERIGAGQL